MAQTKSTESTTGKGAQLRCRATGSEKAHLEQAALDAGFKKKDGTANLSEYMRTVLFGRHVVVSDVGDLILIPAHRAAQQERDHVEGRIERLIAALGSPSPEPVRDTVATRGASDGGGANGDPVAPAATRSAPGPQTSPPAADGLVGTSASRSAPPVEEVPPEPLGAPQLGETATAFLERRVAELRSAGRSTTIARAEAEAEWRQSEVAAVASPPAEQRVCQRCGAVVNAHAPCPECGHA